MNRPSCSSPNSLKQAILSQEAVRILYAISLQAINIARIVFFKAGSHTLSQSS